jgi:hypothetical protein
MLVLIPLAFASVLILLLFAIFNPVSKLTTPETIALKPLDILHVAATTSSTKVAGSLTTSRSTMLCSRVLARAY